MIVKSFGCSFIFGTDLADDGRHLPVPTASWSTWPALIAKKMNRCYCTWSMGGSGNLQILERLLTNISDNDDGIYIVGWTWIDRFDYVDDNLSVPGPGTKWGTLQPTHETDIAKVYYKHLHSEYSDKFHTLLYIRTAIDALQAHGCKFIMTYMDDILLCDRWHTTKAITDLQNQIRPYLSSFDGKTFLDWSKSKGFEISDKSHPLESAHAAAAELILNNWHDFVRT